MRIAIDIDSTLHHYWDVLSEVSVKRFGVELPYEEQLTWGVTRLKPDQLRVCIAESHSDERILAGRPYPGAVETVTRWHEAGNLVHVCSHREPDRASATARWLQRIGLPFDELHCCADKLSRCLELDIGLLIDDNPHDAARALEQGISVATIRHPWNRDLCEEEDIVTADDWHELDSLLTPQLLCRSQAPALPRR